MAGGGLEGPERLIGTRVLEFELGAVLGAGGMSVVYRARHRVTGQEVAIKILPPELAVHDELKARFVEEARVLALLEHPNIVSLNNFCEAGGRLCLIMQFVDGITFEQQILSQSKVAPADVARVGVEVLRALEYAHARNVVHRDIKPSNVLLRSDGAVKVTDFGIAKILGATRLTSTGQTMGTVRYMSPEQVRGKAVGPASDIYSLGVTLFEGLCGRTPFEGENQFEIMQQHLSRKPPTLASRGVVVPAALDKVLARALEKSAKDRFSDAQAFRHALEALLPDAPAEVRASLPGARARRTLAFALGAVVAVGAGGVAFWRLRSPSPSLPAPAKKSAAHASTSPSDGAAGGWIAPHVLPGVRLSLDQTFQAEGLRVESVAPRDAGELAARYRDVRAALAAFLAASQEPAVRAAAKAEVAPLTLVVVPQALLDRPSLWPGYNLKADSSYPSRYVDTHRTLFVAGTAGFESRELPYGVALHVLAPIRALSTDEILGLAEKFAAAYTRQH
ncbi:MAG: serine/threonine protein kinase [Polyangia bacterium]